MMAEKAPYPRRDFNFYETDVGETEKGERFTGLADSTGQIVTGNLPRIAQIEKMRAGQKKTGEVLAPKATATRRANLSPGRSANPRGGSNQ